MVECDMSNQAPCLLPGTCLSWFEMLNVGWKLFWKGNGAVLQAGSRWTGPIWLRIGNSRRFGIDPECCTRILWAPVKPLQNLLYWSDIWSFCYFGGIWAVIPITPPKTHPSSTGRYGFIEHVCKISGKASRKQREHLGFCAENTYFV